MQAIPFWQTHTKLYTLFSTDSHEIIYPARSSWDREVKNQALSSGTSLSRPYKGVPPPPHSPGVELVVSFAAARAGVTQCSPPSRSWTLLWLVLILRYSRINGQQKTCNLFLQHCCKTSWIAILRDVALSSDARTQRKRTALVTRHCALCPWPKFSFHKWVNTTSSSPAPQTKLNSAKQRKIFVLGTHLCTRIWVSATIGLLKKPLSICQSGWQEIRNALPVNCWVR